VCVHTHNTHDTEKSNRGFKIRPISKTKDCNKQASNALQALVASIAGGEQHIAGLGGEHRSRIEGIGG
jgi:hypothetical protein